jgi:hypothetical protein
MKGEEAERLWTMCGRVFSPSAPINKRKLFAGRLDQTAKLLDTINTRGQHAIMYGDRGVGKTSLANILREAYHLIDGIEIHKTNCTEKDTFHSVWMRALEEVPVVLEGPEIDENGSPLPVEYRLSQYVTEGATLGPGDIRRILSMKGNTDSQLVMIFDEFDRLPASERRLYADTIKDLSDNSVDATLLLVGVARDVVELIEVHGSVSRCLAQVFMPPMGREELVQILEYARSALMFTIDKKAVDLILTISQGLPHYTHILGQESFRIAIKAHKKHVTERHVTEAIAIALKLTRETVADEYYTAAEGQRTNTLYPHVLLACALANVDEMGFFRPPDVRDPLERVVGKRIELSNYSGHLKALATDRSRGCVLEQRGSERKYKFRFRNPLLRPFIIMKGLNEMVLSGDMLSQIVGQDAAPPALSNTPMAKAIPPKQRSKPKPKETTRGLFDHLDNQET